jgi:Transposase and inactivated derivatives
MTNRKVAQRIPFTPSKTQAALLEQCFGARHFAYNQQVEAFNTYDKESNPRPVYPGVTDMKNANEWLRDSPIPSSALSNTIMDFRKAQSAYFRKAEYGKHRPRFASKSDNVQSFHNAVPIRRMDGKRYPLSRKLGSVRIRRRDRLRYPLESLSSWTVKRENGTYYLVLLFDVDIQPKPPASGKVGIDLGVKDFLTLSTGEKINYPDRLRRLEENIRRERRKLSRRRKDSSNYRKQKAVVAKAYAKLRHYREDFQHQLSHRLIEENQFIGMETLAVRNMTRKAKKRLDANGEPMRNGQSRKRAMNRSILRNGWSSLVDKLSYKAQWYGRTLVQVDRFYPSSKLCHDCGHKYAGLRLSEREWTCEHCGTLHDRDVNAALNILDEALRLSQTGQ